MSAAEAPKSEQIQANVAAALSRLRGELGASSSPVAGTVQKAVPRSPTEPAEANLASNLASNLGPNLGPLPAGPVRLPESERSNVIRPFEPTLGSTMGAAATPMPAANQAPAAAASPSSDLPKPELVAEPVALPGLFARREPVLSATPADKASTPLTIDADPQPDLLSGVEVPPAPPPPLGALESEDEDSGRGRRMRNRLLVLVLLVVIAGGGAYAYLKAQHTTGPVPVITADTSPEKVKPADEGGMQVPNQNVQILDTINGQQSDQGAEKVLPAPEQPVAPPAVNDAATAETTPPAPAPEPANDNAPMVTDQPVPTVPAPPVPSASTPAPAVSELTQTQEAQPAAPQQPAAEAPKPAATTPEPSAAAPATTAEAPKAPEPAAEAPAPAKTQTAAAPAAATPTVQPAAGGNARIQLAAVKSEALAKEQWAKFQKAHPDLLGALTLSIQKVVVNGADYYRIQAGPLSDKSAAKDLCSKLKAQKQDCLVAK
ncbi:MAG: SPOR domain-containing protein [Dongia sp.]